VGVPEEQRTFRDRWTWVVAVASGVIGLIGGALFAAAGHWLIAAIWLAAGIFGLTTAMDRVVIKDEQLWLHRLFTVRAIPVTDLAWVDPQLVGGALSRCPRIGLSKGEVVRLTPLRAPPAKTHSQAAEDIGRELQLPIKSQCPPPGWYADPISQTGWRHWDGAAWTSLRNDGTRSWSDDYRRQQRHDGPPSGYPRRDVSS
jgi:hypothetical protein